MVSKKTAFFRRATRVQIGIFFLIIIPYSILGFFLYQQIWQITTKNVYQHRQSIVKLSSSIIHDRLDRTVDFSRVFSNQEDLRLYVEQGNWDAALNQVLPIPTNLEYIDRIFLADASGVLWSDFPTHLAQHGQDFSSRDWYKGVLQTKSIFVSPVYQRAAEPQLNVVSVASPIFSSSDASELIGILVVQIKPETFFNWLKSTHQPEMGKLIVVDTLGQAVIDSSRQEQTALQNFSTYDPVIAALQGKTGIQIFADPNKEKMDLSAYQFVSGYGWGVVLSQPLADVFAERNRTLLIVSLYYFFFFCSSLILGYVFIRKFFESKEVTEKLRNVNSFLDSVVENIPNMIFVKDAKELRFVRFNKAGEELLGYDRKDLMGKNDYDFFPKTEADFFTTKDRNVLLGGMLLDIPEEPIHTKLKGIRILHTKKIPILDENGTPEFLLGISEDITEQKKATEELEAFTYSVSHDLRAPLRAIDGFSTILLEDYADKVGKDGRHVIDVIQKNAQKMGRLIDDLLSFSRIGRLEIKRQSINMKKLCEDVYRELKEFEPDRHVQFTAHAMPEVKGDSAFIRLVWSNLISNAMKFSEKKEQSIIDVYGEEKELEFIFWIKDNGAGFDMQFKEKLFQVFQRLHSEEEFEGTGIGLANVKRIIERHGGRVWAEGEVGAGATFYFSLPKS